MKPYELTELIKPEDVKRITNFVMELDMLTGIETDIEEHIETAVIEGMKGGISKLQSYYASMSSEELRAKLDGILESGDMMLNAPEDLAGFINKGTVKRSRFDQILSLCFGWKENQK